MNEIGLKMTDEILERNKNLNRGFRKLEVWREAIELYVFVKENLGQIRGIPFKVRDQILDSAFSIHRNFRGRGILGDVYAFMHLFVE